MIIFLVFGAGIVAACVAVVFWRKAKREGKIDPYWEAEGDTEFSAAYGAFFFTILGIGVILMFYEFFRRLAECE